MKRGPSLIAPALLLPLAAVAALAHKLPASIATALDALPLLVFGGGAVLGLVTRRARLVVGVMILALADSALVNVGSRSVLDAVALLLPLNLAVVVWLGDENPYAGRGALLFAVTLLQAAIIAILLNPQLTPMAEALEVPLASSRSNTGWIGLSHLSVFAFAAALALVITRFVRHGQALAAGAAWALVASFLALDGMSSGGPAGVHFATAGALLLVGATWEPRQVVATDEITRLPTRIELMRAIRRLTHRYTLAFVEVDDYPRFRDEHGVEGAQRMLRQIARRLRRTAHGAQAYYCEGPMFAVLFPRMSAKLAIRHLDAVRVVVEDVTVEVSVSEPPPASRLRQAGVVERTVSVTISAGVAESGRPGEDPKPVLDAAERALARARDGGMNRVSR